MTIVVRAHASPIGRLLLAARGDRLVAVHLPGSAGPPPVGAEGASPILDQTARQLDAYFAGTRTAFDLPLGPEGSAFQRAVWDALLTVPFGETASYGAIARAIGRPSASRAVGAANGRNPIAIIIPCHRVIGAAGALTGYGGGLPTKQFLLRLERATTPDGQRTLWA
jgi:methylated-DNA-[protein]-cysteine S-methyltransferase